MKAKDVMASPVIRVSPDASVAEIARTLLEHRISAVPVIDEAGRLAGIVSEGDLLHRVEADTQRSRSWWLDALASAETLAADYVKAHARKARDVMTARVITVSEEAPLAEIAAVLERNRIKRVVVVRDGEAVGIVSRANLLQGLAADARAEPAAVTADDRTIRDRILAELRAQPWGRSWLVNVTVKDGVVDLWGPMDSAEERRALEVIAENTPGVRAVNNYLIRWPIGAD